VDCHDIFLRRHGHQETEQGERDGEDQTKAAFGKAEGADHLDVLWAGFVPLELAVLGACRECGCGEGQLSVRPIA
jgi:hypothetical protein